MNFTTHVKYCAPPNKQDGKTNINNDFVTTLVANVNENKILGNRNLANL